jgi:hypothetical protein
MKPAVHFLTALTATASMNGAAGAASAAEQVPTSPLDLDEDVGAGKAGVTDIRS